MAKNHLAVIILILIATPALCSDCDVQPGNQRETTTPTEATTKTTETKDTTSEATKTDEITTTTTKTTKSTTTATTSKNPCTESTTTTKTYCITTTATCTITTATSTPEPSPETLASVAVKPLNSHSDCLTLHSGTLLTDARHCRRYYICQNGRAKGYRCPGNKWFDRKTLTCQSREVVTNCPINRS